MEEPVITPTAETAGPSEIKPPEGAEIGTETAPFTAPTIDEIPSTDDNSTAEERASAPLGTFQEMFGLESPSMEDVGPIPSTEETPAEEKPAEETPKEEEKPVEEKPTEEKPVATAIPAEIQALIPEATDPVKFVEEFNTIKAQLNEYRESNDEVVAVLSKSPALIKILKDVKNDVPLYEAIRNHMAIVKDEEIPDPKENPAEYRKYVADQIEREASERKAESERTKRSEKLEVAKKHADSMKDAFIAESKIAPEEVEKFTAFISTMVYGDPETMKLPENYLQVMYKAFKYDEDMSKNLKKGEIKGRNETITAFVEKKPVGDGLPKFNTTGETKKIDKLTDLEESLSRVGADPLAQFAT